MAVELPLELLQWLYKVLLNEYADPKTTYQDACLILINYPSLKPRTRIYTNEQGKSQLLLNLYGTLFLEGVNLELPLDIWFPFEYPDQPPLIHVLTDERFVIKPTNNVQQDGLVFHPFLYDWNQIPERVGNGYKILQLMSLLVDLLQKNPPCIFKPNVVPLELPPHLPPKPVRAPVQGTAPSAVLGAIHGNMNITPVRPTTPVPVQLAQPAQVLPAVKSPSPPVYKELEQLSLMDQDNITTIDQVPKLPPHPTRLQLLNNLNQKLRTISQTEITDVINEEIVSVLHLITTDLFSLQNELLKTEQDQIELQTQINNNNTILKQKIEQVESLNQQLSNQPEYQIDELIVPPTLQHQQLYKLVTRDKAIDDTISKLTSLYELEKLQLSQLLKFVRKLAREQLLIRALISKIIKKLNLNQTDVL